MKPKKSQRQSTDQFCKRLGIKQPQEQGGMEFGWNGPPYQGSQAYSSKREASAPQAESEIYFSDEQDDFDGVPEEFKDHMWKAFIHKAGLGPNPGKFQKAAVTRS